MLTERDPKALAAERFDLVVVGGGVYGIMVALEAVRRGLRPLLVERHDFGSATSYNSLRIVHGGLRYLQTGDLCRYRESVAERRWFLRTFPDLTGPLPCLMPLYGDGMYRPSVFRAALAVNDALSFRRNAGVEAANRLPSGRVVGGDEARSIFPRIDSRALRGAAIWHDGFAPNAPRLLVELLHWACAGGAAVLNHVEATGLTTAGGRVAGVRAVDAVAGGEVEFRADAVINAAGPWAGLFAARCGGEPRNLFTPSIAWNVVFRRPPLSDHAVALRPRRPGARTYFAVPWKGALCVGTGHAPWPGETDGARPTADMLARFLADLNEAVPGIDLGEGDVARVHCGLLPARRPGAADFATREVIVDHGAHGGPGGLFSISGVKLTTSRRVADKALGRAFPSARPMAARDFQRPPRRHEHPDHPFDWLPDPEDGAWLEPLRAAIAEEAVQHLDDLLLRRSSLGDNPERALRLAPRACRLFGWSEERSRREIDALRESLGLPPGTDGDPKGRAAAAAPVTGVENAG